MGKLIAARRPDIGVDAILAARFVQVPADDKMLGCAPPLYDSVVVGVNRQQAMPVDVLDVRNDTPDIAATPGHFDDDLGCVVDGAQNCRPVEHSRSSGIPDLRARRCEVRYRCDSDRAEHEQAV